MIGLTAGITGDPTLDKRVVAATIDELRTGKTIALKMYTDDYIREYASEEDYAFWVSEKKRLCSSDSAA